MAIFKKQVKDTIQNKTVLIPFVMFPFLTLVMSHVINIEGMPPLTSIAAVIAEEKEKNTPRVLMMLNVKPYEYLVGVGSYIWFACMIGAAIGIR